MDVNFDFSVLFDESPVPAWVYDNDTLKFLEVNKAACKKYGYSKNEFLEMTLLDLRSSENKIALKRHFALDKEERNSISRYWEHINKKGSCFYVQICSTPTTVNEKPATLVQVIDVNDRLLTEKENKELYKTARFQKERMDDILSSINEVIWSVRVDTEEFLYINNACYEVLGYTPSAIVANNQLFLNSLHPDDIVRFRQAITDTITNGKGSCTFRVFHKNGTLKILKGSATFRKGENGEPDILSGITMDVTKHAKAEEVLREKMHEEGLIKQKLATDEYNLRALINNTPDLIWSIDREKRIITANEPFKKIINVMYGVELCLGYDMNDFDIPAELYEQWEEYYNKAFKGERFTIIDEQLVNGAKIYLRIRFNPICNEQNTVIGVSCFANDVTEQRTRLIRMQLQNERLKEIAKIQSHEVRGQVASLMGLAQLFNTEDPADPVNATVLEGFKTALEKLDGVIREINKKTDLGEVAF